MKKLSVLLCALCLCTTALTVSFAATPQMEEKTTENSAAVFDPALQVQDLSDYYLLKGSKYEKVTGLLQTLPSNVSGLNGAYYWRVEKHLVGDYFYRVRAYQKDTHVLVGNYLVAKDQSCAWKLTEGQEAQLIYGSPENLLDKIEIVVYPKKIPLGSYGIVRVHVPGMIPYDLKVSSLDSTVASISEKMNILPQQVGKTDLVIDVKIGNSIKTVTKTISVFDPADKKGRHHRDPGIGIGVGIGWGSGWHHHGGIGIGVGPWW